MEKGRGQSGEGVGGSCWIKILSAESENSQKNCGISERKKQKLQECHTAP